MEERNVSKSVGLIKIKNKAEGYEIISTKRVKDQQYTDTIKTAD